MDVIYERVCVGTRRVDFFIENIFMVELKALSELESTHLAQSINYLEAYKLPVGLLINFGAKSLEFKRVYNTKHPDSKKQE
jgi:GxxExxY protein